MFTLTIADLEREDACPEGKDLFLQWFPSGTVSVPDEDLDTVQLLLLGSEAQRFVSWLLLVGLLPTLRAPGADLRGANLYGADLEGADLRGANLYGADLEHANLIDADLRGADLRSAELRWANLSGAQTEGAQFEGAGAVFTFFPGEESRRGSDGEVR